MPTCVIGLAKTLSLELDDDRITINTLCPGFINTTRLDKVFRGNAEGAGGRICATVIRKLTDGFRRDGWGTPEDIALMVALVASPRRSL